MFFAGRFTLSQSSPPVRNATYLRTFLLRIYSCLSRDFVNQHVFLLLDLHWDSPKLFCFLFSPCLSRDSLSCDTRSYSIVVFYLSLYFYTSDRTSDKFRPIFALFTHFTLYQFFLIYITTRNIFLIPDVAVAQNLIIIFNFSIQRPHLNYIFLSKVYSFDTMEFSSKYKC